MHVELSSRIKAEHFLTELTIFLASVVCGFFGGEV